MLEYHIFTIETIGFQLLKGLVSIVETRNKNLPEIGKNCIIINCIKETENKDFGTHFEKNTYSNGDYVITNKYKGRYY